MPDIVAGLQCTGERFDLATFGVLRSIRSKHHTQYRQSEAELFLCYEMIHIRTLLYPAFAPRDNRTLVLPACGFGAQVFHAAKAEMVGAGIDFAFTARADDVARAILVVAQKRTAAVHALLFARLGRIERSIRPFRIDR